MTVIGLTGGIGSGKSTVANIFSKQGVDIIDTDLIAREVVCPGSESLIRIAEYFGQSILTAEGELNRAKLREHILAHPDDRKWLEKLLHPKIRSKMREEIASAQSPYCLAVIPLLIENNVVEDLDRILVIDISSELQISRLMARENCSKEHALAMIAIQADNTARLQMADDIITNHNDLQELHQQVETLHEQYVKLASRKTSC